MPCFGVRCCDCHFCGDRKTPDEVVLTASGWPNRIHTATGRLIQEFSGLNQAHTLARVFRGTLSRWNDPEGGDDDPATGGPCMLVYEGGPFAFGDMFTGDALQLVLDYENEALWLRDRVYNLRLRLQVNLDGSGYHVGQYTAGAGLMQSYVPDGDGEGVEAWSDVLFTSAPLAVQGPFCSTPVAFSPPNPTHLKRVLLFDPEEEQPYAYRRADNSPIGDEFATFDTSSVTASLIASAARS